MVVYDFYQVRVSTESSMMNKEDLWNKWLEKQIRRRKKKKRKAEKQRKRVKIEKYRCQCCNRLKELNFWHISVNKHTKICGNCVKRISNL